MLADEYLADRVGGARVAAVTAGVSYRGTRAVASAGRIATTADSAYRIASLTKLFTSAALVTVLAERSIPLSTAAIELIGSLAADWRADRAITVGQLLGQVAGLRESVDSAVLAALGDGDDVLREGARLVVRAGSGREPGARWSYYNGNYFLAGAILAAVTGTSYEDALGRAVLRPWQLDGTGFATPAAPVTGHEDDRPLPATPYPRSRRPSGGLWSCVADLLTFAEHLLASGPLLEQTVRPQTRSGDPMTYGLGWALGPSGQMYLNGRLAGYRTALLLLPEHGYASVALAAEEQALPQIAALLSDLQRPLTGDDLSTPIDTFAA